jgi:cation diffusion facilitator family transporter
MSDSTTASPEPSRRIRFLVAGFSILAGLAILVAKYWAYRISGSAALMSDAIEGVVNVVAAVFALGAVLFAERPPDREHPYGHGKIEHFSAAFEGGLISLAAALILWEAVDALIHGPQIRNLGMGLLLNAGAGALNGLLGLFLVRMGRRHGSRAIEADGHHVLSDFWTTLGLALGLLVVRFTGLHWVDPVLAIGVSALLAGTGFRLVRTSSQALLDQEDPALLARLVDVLNKPDERPTWTCTWWSRSSTRSAGPTTWPNRWGRWCWPRRGWRARCTHTSTPASGPGAVHAVWSPARYGSNPAGVRNP